MRYCFFTIFLFVISSGISIAQTGRKMTRQEYIETYNELAKEEMERTGIPASITLSQGVLESGDGNSRLARTGNNHFGIKCHDWTGKTIYEDDDANNECFRKYKSVEESYRDHSDFLKTRQRYAQLFTNKPDDYQAWAKGLKEAGYATSPTYTKALIKIIEENKLYLYDQQVLAKTGGKVNAKLKENTIEYAGGRIVYKNNRVKFVKAREGDTFGSISVELDFFSWELSKYNDLPEDYTFHESEKVYIETKKNKAEPGKKIHKVVSGETLLSIAQLYAIKLNKLARNNGLTINAELTAGTELFIRGRNKSINRSIAAPKIDIKDTNSKTKDEEFKVDLNIEK